MIKSTYFDIFLSISLSYLLIVRLVKIFAHISFEVVLFLAFVGLFFAKNHMVVFLLFNSLSKSFDVFNFLWLIVANFFMICMGDEKRRSLVVAREFYF